MTPTLISDMRACLIVAEKLEAPELVERLRHCIEAAEEMAQLPLNDAAHVEKLRHEVEALRVRAEQLPDVLAENDALSFTLNNMRADTELLQKENEALRKQVEYLSEELAGLRLNEARFALIRAQADIVVAMQALLVGEERRA